MLMRISRYQLRVLVESVLLEGFKDDQRYLTEKYPEHAQDLSRLQPKWIAWLTARFGENPRVKEVHPFEDAIVTALNFSRKDAAIGEKYRSNEQFRTAIDTRFPPDTRSWSSPADPTTMTVDEMETILGLSERKKQRIEVNEAEDVEGDRVGKVGPWNLWMPTSREKSCKIAGYDPITLKTKTSWCTARMSGANLFYNYVSKGNVIFYLIRDNPKSVTDWVSIGFKGETPVLHGYYGGPSADRDDTSLTPEYLKSILGEYYDEILETLTQKVKQISGVHPAKSKLEAASQSVEALRDIMRSLSVSESDEMKDFILARQDVSLDVLQTLSRDKNEVIAAGAIEHPSAPPELVNQAAESTSTRMRCAAALSPKISEDNLDTLSNDEDESVRSCVAGNRKTRTDTLIKLSLDKSADVRSSVASRVNDAETIARLSKDRNAGVRKEVVQNPNIPIDLLKNLHDNDRVSHVRDFAGIFLKRRTASVNESRLRRLIRYML